MILVLGTKENNVSNTRPLRGIHDVRSMRTAIGRSRPTGEQEIYVDMLRLMTEKARLERELAMWQANVQRIQKRLDDIGAQMQQLDQIAASERQKRDGTGKDKPPWEEMILTY